MRFFQNNMYIPQRTEKELYGFAINTYQYERSTSFQT